jgi:hypothetical protein
MSTKLTLTIDSEIAEKVKKYAAETGNSLSELVEDYLYTLMQRRNLQQIQPSGRVKKLRGILTGLDDVDYKSMVESQIIKRHRK